MTEDRRLAGTLLEAHRSLEDDGASEEGRRRLAEAAHRLFTAPGDPWDAPTDGNTGDPRVGRCRELIERRFREPLCLEELARTAGTSPSHLVRIFRREVGTTPYDYLLLVRVQEAQKRLAAGWEIVAAAHEVGFADQSHLHRHFKRRLGVTPGAFQG